MTVSLILFHGTSQSSASGIEKSGFTFLLSRSLSYGDGAYFYRDLDKALEHARQKSDADACVLEVEVTCPQERVWTISGYEKYNFDPSDFNKKAVEQRSLMLDVSIDDGIYVVRPEGLPLVRVRRRCV